MLYFCAYLKHEPRFRAGSFNLQGTASRGGTPQHRLYTKSETGNQVSAPLRLYLPETFHVDNGWTGDEAC